MRICQGKVREAQHKKHIVSGGTGRTEREAAPGRWRVSPGRQLLLPDFQGRVRRPVPEPCHFRVIQGPDSLSLPYSRQVRIDACRRLIGSRSTPLIWICQNRSRVKYHKVATAAVTIESPQILDRHVFNTTEIW